MSMVKGGNRGQGVNDGMFGGNFNRIKNLMVQEWWCVSLGRVFPA